MPSRPKSLNPVRIDDLVEASRRAVAQATELEARSVALVLESVRPTAQVEHRSVRAGAREHPALFAVSVQTASANRKLAPQRVVDVPDVRDPTKSRTRFEPLGPYCASTYVSIAATCPHSCPFRDNGCYAQAGASHLTMGALDRAGRRTRGLEVSLAEAAKLDDLWRRGVPQDGHRGGRDLRLHVGGDVSCEAGTRAVARAVERLQARGLGATWTYTHRWREIPREAFGSIAVLASCETAQDVTEATALGYAAAVTVERFPGRRAFPIAPGVKAIPCPYEGGGTTTCVKCRLCFDDDRLRQSGRAIAFAVHGADSERAGGRLRVLNGRSATGG
jgi:hypothetical protein